jgi:UDP-glucose 4-epimerase
VVGFSSRSADLRNAEGIRNLEGAIDAKTVLICASAITRDRGDTLQTCLDNIAMAGHLGAFLEEHRPARCVYFSSDAVYPMVDVPLTEATPVSPGGTFYAVAKFAAEGVLRRSMERGGIPLLILRPTGIYGAGDTHNSYGPNAFARSAVLRRAVRLFGEGEERRDHLYVDDCVRLVARLIDSEAVGVVNLASGVSHSFAAVLDALRRVAPFDVEVSRLPRTGPVRHREFDITHLRRLAGKFRFTSLEDGLRATLSQLRAAAPERLC